MLYALSSTGQKIPPSPGIEGFCQLCKQPMLAKCGEIKIWHWSHKTLSPECEGYEETDWHRYWKSKFPINNTEVRIERCGYTKIADIQLDCGMVIELQHSPITPAEIRLRESFYDNMKWIFDCREPFRMGRIVTYQNNDVGGWNLHWKQSKKIITHCTKPVLLATERNFFALFDRLDENEFIYDYSPYAFEDFLKDHA